METLELPWKAGCVSLSENQKLCMIACILATREMCSGCSVSPVPNAGPQMGYCSTNTQMNG